MLADLLGYCVYFFPAAAFEVHTELFTAGFSTDHLPNPVNINWEQRENTILFWSFHDLAAWGHKNMYCDYYGFLLVCLFIYLFDIPLNKGLWHDSTLNC